MIKPDLGLIAKWLNPVIVEELDKKRHLRKEWRRYRKLGTLETLWLMLAVSLDTGRSSLHEIIRLATGDLNISWSVSVAGFCKARSRFSLGCAFMASWPTAIEHSESQREKTESLERIATACGGQDNSCLTRISISLGTFRRTQRCRGWGLLQWSFAVFSIYSPEHHCALSMTRSAPLNKSSSKTSYGTLKKATSYY